MANIKIIGDDYQTKLPIDFDPSKYKTAAGAAKAFHKALCKLAASLGQNPDIEISLRKPEEAAEMGCGRFWQVCWEAGPFEWGVACSLTDLFNQGHWYTEPYYSFDVCFVPI